jgi:putative membrane protein
VQAWTLGAPPLALRWLLIVALASGVTAHLATAAMAHRGARWMVAVKPGLLAGAALAILVTAVLVLSGGMGLAIFLAATVVGLLPLATGTGRIHLTGCLLVPVLAYRLGLA